MANSVAPGVYTKIIDLSTYIQDVPGTLGFVPFFSRLGPDNDLTYVTSLQEYVEDFGRPNINDFGKAFGQGPYIAFNHIQVSPAFYVMRVLPDDATLSNLMVTYNSDSTGSIVVSHEFGIEQPEDFDPILDNATGAPGTSPNKAPVAALTGDDISAKNDLTQLSDDEPAPIYLPVAGDRVASTFDNLIYIAQPAGNTWIVAPDGNLISGDSFITNVDLTKSPGAAEINAQYALIGTTLTEVVPTGDLFPLFAIHAVGRGDAYDDFGVTITRSVNETREGVHVIDIWRTQSDGEDSIVESFDVSFDEEAIDDSGDSQFIEDVVNRFSKWVRVRVQRDAEDNTTHLNEYLKSGINITVGDSITPFHLFGGSEGSLVTVDPDTGKRTIDSTVAIQTLTNAYLGLIDEDVIDLDDIYFPLVYDAGYPTEVKNAIVTLVNDIRRDGVAIMDNGDNQTATDAEFVRNNTHTYNSRYVSLFEPYSKIFDVQTGKDIFFTPVYHMSRMIPLNDRLFNIWFPNAGFNRATIDGIKELRYNAKLGQRERFQLNQLNPIVKFTIGFSVFGNLTTQRRPSALQDLSIMRTVLYVKRGLEQFLKFFIFEFNDPETHQRIANEIKPFLEAVKSARGLTAYNIEVGATDYERKQKIAHVNVELEPTRIIERIELNLFVR